LASPPLRLGLVGAGRWGRNYIRTIANVEGVTLARLASRAPDAAALAGDGCVVSADWTESIFAGDLDGVIVATPPATHADIVRAAIEAGLPTLVEKPLTTSRADAEALLALAEDRGVPVMVDHTYLFHPGFRAMKREAVDLGELQALRTAGGTWGPFRGDVDVLWDWGPHDVAMCLDLVGDRPVKAEAWSKDRQTTPDGPGEVIALRLTFNDGLAADIHIGNLMEHRTRFVAANFNGHELIFSDEGGDVLTRAVRLDNAQRTTEEEPSRAIPVDDAPPLTVVVQEFAEAIRHPSRDLSGLRLAVDVVSVLEQCEAALGR